MESQHAYQSETSARQAKKGNGVNLLPMAALVLVIIATAFVIILLTKFAAASSSNLSSFSIIDTQNGFHDNLTSTQEEFQQQVDAATKEAKRMLGSI